MEPTDIIFLFEKEEAIEYFTVCKYKMGEWGTGTGEEFSKPNYERYGLYIVEIVSKEEINSINLLPPEAKEFIIENNKRIFSLGENDGRTRK